MLEFHYPSPNGQNVSLHPSPVAKKTMKTQTKFIDNGQQGATKSLNASSEASSISNHSADELKAPIEKVIQIGEKTITSAMKTLELDPDYERIIAVHFNKSDTKLFIKEL